MNAVSPNLIGAYQKLLFNFSFTLRNQAVNLDSFTTNYVLDVDGLIYEKNSNVTDVCSVTIVGGIDAFMFEKELRAPVNFFITDAQRVVIYRIMKALSRNTDTAQVDANQDTLLTFLQALYSNLCG